MSRYIWLIISAWILCFAPARLAAQPVSTPKKLSAAEQLVLEQDIKRGIDNIYNFEFEKADAIFGEFIRRDPKSPVGPFFLGMVLWWKIMLDIENTTHDDAFIKQMDDVVELCDERLERNSQDIEALFFKGGAMGFRGRLRANRGSWIKAAGDGKDALPIVERCKKLDSKNYDVLFGVGLYNYYAEAIPEKNPVLKPLVLLFPKGDKKKGIEMLELVSEKGKYAQTESLYFLLQIYYIYERDYTKAVFYAKKLYEKYPANSFFYRYLGRAYAASGFWKDADVIFREVLAKRQQHAPYYNEYVEREARYYVAMSLMNDHKSTEALEHFKLADKLCMKVDRADGSAYKTIITLRIGMLYDLLGNRPSALEQYKRVLEMKDYQDAHVQAKQYLKQPHAG